MKPIHSLPILYNQEPCYEIELHSSFLGLADSMAELGLKNNSTLYHLNMMEKQKLLNLIVDGKKIYYQINCNYLNSLQKLLETMKKDPIGQLPQK